jgi:hypothetical protein
MIEAQKVKEDRRRSHTRAGKEKPKAERKSEFLWFSDTVKVADDPQRLSSRSRSSGVHISQLPAVTEEAFRTALTLYLYHI